MRADRPILILTASAGAGHTVAAQGVEAAVRALAPNETVEVHDVLTSAGRFFRKLYGDGYLAIVRHVPVAMGWLYDSMDRPTRRGPDRLRDRCVEFIKGEVARGKTVYVYGASTKGNVILQYYGLDHTLIAGASEKSPEKWGKYTIGTWIPIVSEEEARRAQPDYFLVLPWAFFDEFYEREREWRERGGQFIVPLPEFRVVP